MWLNKNQSHIHVLHAIFFNNLTNYLYFFNKNLCLILNAFMYLHGLHASSNNAIDTNYFTIFLQIVDIT